MLISLMVFCEMRGRTGWVPRNFIGEESACASARPAQSSRSETVPSTAADSKRQEDECDRCAKLEKQIQDLKLAIAEIKKTSQSPFNGKAIGTYTVLRKESRYYVVEATFPGTTEKQYFKWYFDPVEASESLSG
ncbi:unnamed protein product [Symbiodinium natans]|uniref:Uncharacterized protein n=1 Tax=Symbiodinium natans TaxID=878477 RepID=A0A812UUR0_9DINO|nr:unnamed protein product [Symbiodinium natans]